MAYRSKQVIKKDIIGKLTRQKFENIYLNETEKYDEYLTHIYGDWRQITPDDKRQCVHSYLYVDLDYSYKNK